MNSVRKPLNLARFNALCYACALFLGIYFTSSQTVMLRVCADFGANSALMGVIIGIFFAGQIISSLVMGEVSEKQGKKNTLSLALILVALGCVLTAVSQNYLMACAGQLVSGFGFGATECINNAALVQENPPGSHRQITQAQGFFSIGAVCSPLLIGFYFANGGSWRGVYLAVAVLMSLLFIGFLTQPFGRAPTRGSAQNTQPATPMLLKSPIFLMLCLLIAGSVACETGVTFWIMPMSAQLYPRANMGELLITAYWLTSTVSRFVFARVSNPYKILKLGYLMSAVSCLLIVLGLRVPGLLIAGVCSFSFFLAPVWPIGFNLGADRFPTCLGAAFGLMQVGTALGGMVSQPIIGSVVQLTGNVSFAFVLVTVLCLLFLLLSMRTQKLHQTNPLPLSPQ